MKLKQRVVVTLGCLATACVLLLGHSAILDHFEFFPAVQKLNQGVRASQQRLIFTGHLQARRSLVDKSNYSENKSPERNRLRSELTALIESVKDELAQGDLLNTSEGRRKLIHLSSLLQDEPGKVVPGETDSNGGEHDPREQTSHSLGRNYMHAQGLRKMTSDGQETRELELQYFKGLLDTKNHRKVHRRKGERMMIYEEQPGFRLSSWEQFHNQISQFELYGDESMVDQLLEDIASKQIVDVEMKPGGTQLKLVFTFADEGKALFKPMRFSRDQETLPDHFYFVDYERHNAEIAAFHLDRILGFHRAPPTGGRIINVTYDIKRHANHKLAKTFFISPAKNVCFHGSCSYYCDTSHAVCGHPDMLEGSFAALLPSTSIVPRRTWRHPWRRSYSKHRKSVWEVDNDYCLRVKHTPPYDTGRRLLDLMDMAVYDFLSGNMDRHHYETFTDFGNFSFTLFLDQGRAFGKSKHDEMSILAPIYQCCLMRYSTLKTLASLEHGPRKLSQLMRRSLERDKLRSVLTEPHLQALDRRVKIILKTVYKCIQKVGSVRHVVIDDGF